MGLPPSAEPTSPRGLFPGNEEASVRGTLARVFMGDVIRGDRAIEGEDKITPRLSLLALSARLTRLTRLTKSRAEALTVRDCYPDLGIFDFRTSISRRIRPSARSGTTSQAIS